MLSIYENSKTILLDSAGMAEWKLPGRLVRFSRNSSNILEDSFNVKSAPIDAEGKVGTFVEPRKINDCYQIPFVFAGETLTISVGTFPTNDSVHLWGSSSAISATCGTTRIVLLGDLGGEFGKISTSKMLITPLEGNGHQMIFGSALPVFKIINFEGALHNFEAVPNRPGFWHLSPYTGPLAPVRLTSSATTQRCRISLVAKDGSMGTVGFAGDTLQVIPGEYLLSKPTIGLASVSGSVVHWLHPDYEDSDLTVTVPKTGCGLVFGPPLILQVQAVRTDQEVSLEKVSLLGAAQERYLTRGGPCTVQWALVKGESRLDVGKLEYG